MGYKERWEITSLNLKFTREQIDNEYVYDINFYDDNNVWIGEVKGPRKKLSYTCFNNENYINNTLEELWKLVGNIGVDA